MGVSGFEETDCYFSAWLAAKVLFSTRYAAKGWHISSEINRRYTGERLVCGALPQDAISLFGGAADVFFLTRMKSEGSSLGNWCSR